MNGKQVNFGLNTESQFTMRFNKYFILLVSTELEIRLVDGTSPTEGRIEVKYNGIWGTVCRMLFDDKDAAVFCRTMGLRYVI